MKNAFLIYIFIVCFFSCNQSEKYQGKWTQHPYKSSELEQPFRIIIENDSIKFNYIDFDYWHQYPLTIDNNILNFGGFQLNAKIIDDTLSLNTSSYYIKDDNDSIKNWFRINNKMKIEFPKLNSLKSKNNLLEDANTHIHIVKRHDNQEFSLKLNDKYAGIGDLSSFVSPGHRTNLKILSNLIYCDKDTPMKFLEAVFIELQKMNQLQVLFINDIELYVNDSSGLFYKYSFLSSKLSPFLGDDYHSSLLKFQTPPPPPPYKKPNKENALYLLLIENKIYYNGIETNFASITNLIQERIKEKKAIISLYDLKSNYKSFLELKIFIDSIYDNIRQQNSTTKFNKKLTELSPEELKIIKLETPKKYVWSYSIPHYTSLLKGDKLFFGPNTVPIENLMPIRKDTIIP